MATAASTTSSPRSKTDPNFDPNRWLDEWQIAGGHVVVMQWKVAVGATLGGGDPDAQRRLWSQLDAKPGRRALVRIAALARWTR